MKVRCENLLCHAEPIEISEEQEQHLESMLCTSCNYTGMLPEGHVLKSKKIFEQLFLWSDTVLFRDAFSKMNMDKLPRNMSQQRIR